MVSKKGDVYMAKENPSKPKELVIELVAGKNPKLGRIYSNYVSVSQTPWDFTLRFCDTPPRADVEVSERAGEEGSVIAEAPAIVDVIIPAAIMPALINAMRSQLNKYKAVMDTEPKNEKTN